MSSLKIDLVKDWQNHILEVMKNEGLNNTSKMKIDQLIIRYFTYLRKKEPGLKHKIHFSQEFVCPEKFIKSLCTIIDLLKTGGDIGPYLSTSAVALKNDYMFNNWGIIHLHLGEKPYKNDPRFIERTGLLLFIFRQDNDAYLINTSEHGRWSILENLEILGKNWPEQFNNRKLNGITGLNHIMTDEERFNLWKVGGDTVTEVTAQKGETVIIVPPGGGCMTSGDSQKDTIFYLNMKKRIKANEKAIICNIELIKSKMRAENIQPVDSLEFKLLRADGAWNIVEKSSNWILTGL